MRQFPDNDVLGRMQSALTAWRRLSEAMRQIVRASEGQASRALFDDLEAVAHAFDSFPMLWSHVGDLRDEIRRLKHGSSSDALRVHAELQEEAFRRKLPRSLPAAPVDPAPGHPPMISDYEVPPGVTMHQDTCASIRDWTNPCDCGATVTPKEVAQGFLDPPLPREVLTRLIGGPQNAPDWPLGPETPADPLLACGCGLLPCPVCGQTLGPDRWQNEKGTQFCSKFCSDLTDDKVCPQCGRMFGVASYAGPDGVQFCSEDCQDRAACKGCLEATGGRCRAHPAPA